MPEWKIWHHYDKQRRMELVNRFLEYSPTRVNEKQLDLFNALRDKGIKLETVSYEVLKKELSLFKEGNYLFTEDPENRVYLLFPDNNNYTNFRLVTYADGLISLSQFCFVISGLNDFHFHFKHWKLDAVVECIVHIHEYFDSWSKEIKLLKYEIAKRQMVRELLDLKTRVIETRKIEKFISSQYNGQCNVHYESFPRVDITASLRNGYSIELQMPIGKRIPNWGDYILEIATKVIDYANEKADKEYKDWDEMTGYIGALSLKNKEIPNFRNIG